jgi:sugar phosphate isomerase/epimerase
VARPITLCTGQWADMPLAVLAQKTGQWGFDGLEVGCWGDHFDPDKALDGDRYVREHKALLEKHNLKVFAISNHLIGQCVCDWPLDERHRRILPKAVWGDGKADGIRERCAEHMKKVARAARVFGVTRVNGFTGSSIWHKFFAFPPITPEEVEAGFKDFADRWIPILDVFKKEGVSFNLEVHPTEIAYDFYTTRRAIEAVGGHPAFCINFDPSHFAHQFLDPVPFIEEFAPRIRHVHIKDCRVRLDGRSSILCSHLDFGDPRRGWDFVTAGRGDVKFDQIIRALNRIGYDGPLSIEWEDSGMDREFGAREALEFLRRQNFSPSKTAFDMAFAAKE